MNAEPNEPSAEPSCSDEIESTGLPWPKSWMGVYIFVFSTFLVWLGLLIVLTEFFS